jgi:multisubunit Na+/H+ antiporter MnhC subunit
MAISNAVANGATAVVPKANAVLVRPFAVLASVKVAIARSSSQCHQVVRWLPLQPQSCHHLPHLAPAESALTGRVVARTSICAKGLPLEIAAAHPDSVAQLLAIVKLDAKLRLVTVQTHLFLQMVLAEEQTSISVKAPPSEIAAAHLDSAVQLLATVKLDVRLLLEHAPPQISRLMELAAGLRNTSAVAHPTETAVVLADIVVNLAITAAMVARQASGYAPASQPHRHLHRLVSQRMVLAEAATA